MLRITETSVDEHSVTLRLDGKLINTSLSDLEQLCLRYTDQEKKDVVLDFSGISFMDTEAVKTLRRIKDRRVKILNCSLFIAALLADPENGR